MPGFPGAAPVSRFPKIPYEFRDGSPGPVGDGALKPRGASPPPPLARRAPPCSRRKRDIGGKWVAKQIA